MSVINKMLKELDQRQASPPAGSPAVRPLRTGVEPAGKGKEGFWRLLAILMLASVAWIGVIAYQTQVRPVVTTLAFKAAEDASARRAQRPPAPVAVAAIPAVPERGTAPPLVNPDLLKLAPSIETPIPSEPARRPLASPGRPTVSAAAVLPKVAGTSEAGRSPQPSKPLAGPVEDRVNQGKVAKGNRPRTPQEFAEAEFRRGAGLLNEGRVADAKEVFSAALKADRNHESARQALIALLLDQRQIDPARQLLQEGLAINPGNAVFASSLARILIEAREYDGALKVLQGASAAGASSAEYQALAGAAYQRLGNHRQAMEAYQAALRIVPDSGSSWIGLAISLDALDHPREAAEAFRRALAMESLTPDLRAFAETSLSKQK
jgi:MSHA biogenesis protein MshN